MTYRGFHIKVMFFFGGLVTRMYLQGCLRVSQRLCFAGADFHPELPVPVSWRWRRCCKQDL